MPLSPPSTVLGRLAHVGPGVIVSASIVGSGELIVTTRLGAELGMTLLWLVVLSCLVKVQLAIELGRCAVARGETTLRALDAVPGPRFGAGWLVWTWAVMALGSIFQLGGILLSLAVLFALVGASGSPLLWAAGLAALTAALLSSGRYRHVERTCTVLVGLFTLLTLVAVVAVQSGPDAIVASELADGLSFGLPEDDGLVTAIAVLGITGVGASELVYYPYWCLEKGYASNAGPPPAPGDADEAAWRERADGWLAVLKTDAWIAFAVYTTATVAFYVLGAAVLHRRGIVPGDDDVHALSAIYTNAFGDASGTWLYVAGAFAVLFSTFFVASASNARVLADAAGVFRVARGDDDARARRVRILCLGIPAFCLATVAVASKPVTLILVGAIAQAAFLPLLAGATLWLRYRYTPRVGTPGVLADGLLWLGFAVMALLGVHQLWSRLGPG